MKALPWTDKNDERLYEAELYRLKGDLPPRRMQKRRSRKSASGMLLM